MRTGTIGAETSARSASALAGLLLAVFGSCSGDRIIRPSPSDNMRVGPAAELREAIAGPDEGFAMSFFSCSESPPSPPPFNSPHQATSGQNPDVNVYFESLRQYGTIARIDRHPLSR